MCSIPGPEGEEGQLWNTDMVKVVERESWGGRWTEARACEPQMPLYDLNLYSRNKGKTLNSFNQEAEEGV